MHILEIPSFFTPYGGEFCHEQAKALKALGHEVRILSNVQLGVTIGLKNFLLLPYHRDEYQRDGITICQSFQRGVPRMIHYNMMRWVTIVESMFRDYVSCYGTPDIIHAHCAKWAGYVAMKISQEHRIPYVITEHLPKMILSEEFGEDSGKAWQVPLLREAYEAADMVVPVSEELVEDISCYFGNDYRWQSISNTIDTDFFHYQPRSSCKGRHFRFCCVADNLYRKGYDVLIPAFRLLEEQGYDAELRIAGRNTDTTSFRSRLSSGITSLGQLHQEQVRDLLYQSDALVLASRSEVQPLVLLEAMSTGIPVISTECIPQSLRIDGGCTIVPMDDAEAMAAAMKQVMKKPFNDGLRLSEQVKAMASPKVVGEKLEMLFRNILSA